MKKGDVWETIVPLFRNKYVLTVFGFLIWITIFDDDNLLQRFELNQKVNELEAEKQQLIQNIEQDRRKMDELKSNKENLEKFAREEYFMKRDNEVIFIVK